MTPVPASLRLLLTGEPRFRQCTAVAPLSPKALLIPSIAVTSSRLQPPRRPVDHRDCRPDPNHADQRITCPSRCPVKIPIDGARPHGGPRVPSWEAFRRRPPRARANSYDGAGIRNPSPNRTSRVAPPGSRPGCLARLRPSTTRDHRAAVSGCSTTSPYFLKPLNSLDHAAHATAASSHRHSPSCTL